MEPFFTQFDETPVSNPEVYRWQPPRGPITAAASTGRLGGIWVPNTALSPGTIIRASVFTTANAAAVTLTIGGRGGVAGTTIASYTLAASTSGAVFLQAVVENTQDNTGRVLQTSGVGMAAASDTGALTAAAPTTNSIVVTAYQPWNLITLNVTAGSACFSPFIEVFPEPAWTRTFSQGTVTVY